MLLLVHTQRIAVYVRLYEITDVSVFSVEFSSNYFFLSRVKVIQQKYLPFVHSRIVLFVSFRFITHVKICPIVHFFSHNCIEKMTRVMYINSFYVTQLGNVRSSRVQLKFTKPKLVGMRTCINLLKPGDDKWIIHDNVKRSWTKHD